jgi:hypothetical protein
MNRSGSRERVSWLARAAVSEIAKQDEIARQELALFDLTCEAYFASTRRGRTGRRRGTEIEFDGQQMVSLVTTAALASSMAVLEFLATQAGEAAFDLAGGQPRIRWLLRRLGLPLRGLVRKFGWSRPTPPVHAASHALSPEQLVKVREIAFHHASTLDLPNDKAALLADAIVGRLATGDDVG